MDNVESAEVAGDAFPTTRVLTADGVVSFIGCMMGNPFIKAVYIGHPGWKAMGGRIGYPGLEVLGEGAILTGLILAAVAVCVIEKNFTKASAFAFAGAVLIYFGFMHGAAVGIGNGLGVTPGVTLAYLIVAGALYATARVAAASPAGPGPAASAAPAE